MIIISVIILAIFSMILIKSADLTVSSLKQISNHTKTGVFALSAIILALGTSFPELSVGFTSALSNSPNLSLGVVVGSNIVNISLVAGLTALFAGKVHINQNYLKRDIAIALIASLAPLILLLDGTLSRIDGIVLLAIYASYASSFFKKRYQEVARGVEVHTFLHSIFRHVNNVHIKGRREWGKLFVGIASLLFSADIIVRVSKSLAESFGIPLFVVGLIVLAIGTSLPELAFSFRSLKEHEPSMFYGNLLGSSIANSTLIIGVASTITPITLKADLQYFFAAVSFIVIFLLFWYFTRTKQRLDRWEALVLLLLYITFAIGEFILK